jgi:hypothetical protein
MVKKFVTKNLDVRKMFLSVGGGLKSITSPASGAQYVTPDK